jgi:Domain of unknown function (DUF4411)
MKKYCFDTSGISNPLETMPEDIYDSVWIKVKEIVSLGHIAVTKEIHDEMCHIPGSVGQHIKENKSVMIMEVGDTNWNWSVYVDYAKDIQENNHEFISEYNGGSPKTICLTDISIIALAKALSLPVVSMEARVVDSTAKKRRIPNICATEAVEHLTFNDFLRRENVRF